LDLAIGLLFATLRGKDSENIGLDNKRVEMEKNREKLSPILEYEFGTEEIAVAPIIMLGVSYPPPT
jgi:hypothetical protein